MELELYLMNFDEQAVKSIHHYEFELSKISTGRANPQLIKGIKIDYYGTMTPLEELANISVPEASQLLVKPFDVSSVKDIAKALMAANLGINPVDEGNQVRLTFPALTSDRRKELVKSLAKFTEQAKIGVRNARQDVLKAIKADEELSEDEQKRYQDTIQKQVDIKIELINKITQEKEKELTTL